MPPTGGAPASDSVSRTAPTAASGTGELLGLARLGRVGIPHPVPVRPDGIDRAIRLQRQPARGTAFRTPVWLTPL